MQLRIEVGCMESMLSMTSGTWYLAHVPSWYRYIAFAKMSCIEIFQVSSIYRTMFYKKYKVVKKLSFFTYHMLHTREHNWQTDGMISKTETDSVKENILMVLNVFEYLLLKYLFILNLFLSLLISQYIDSLMSEWSINWTLID